MKKLAYIFCGILLLALASCAVPPELEKSPYGAADKLADVTMTIKEGTLTKQDETATNVIKNHSNKDYIFGAPYEIETERDGEWYALSDKDRAWIDIGYMLHPNSTWEEEISLFGTLEPGRYRIVKTFWFDDGTSGVVFGAFAVE